jgi:hypothetical protein
MAPARQDILVRGDALDQVDVDGDTYSPPGSRAPQVSSIGADPFGDAQPLNDDGLKPGQKMSEVYNLTLSVSNGATMINGGKSAPADTVFAAGIQAMVTQMVEITATITFKASTMKGLGPLSLLKKLTWTGGFDLPNKDLGKRGVSRTAHGKLEVTCALGDLKQTIVIYIIGAKPTGFQGDSGTHFSDNSITAAANNKGSPNKLGVGLDAANSTIGGACEIEFTILPAELLTDGNNNVFDTTEIKWDVTREKKVEAWFAKPAPTGMVWTKETKPDLNISNWKDDDDSSTDEDNDPWGAGGGGHLYGNDWPFVQTTSDAVGYVIRMQMREWVRVAIGGGSGNVPTSAGTPRCSDYQLWHFFGEIQKVNGSWTMTSSFGGNEITVGNPTPAASPGRAVP